MQLVKRASAGDDASLNEFGRFDRLKTSLGKEKARAFFSASPESQVSRFIANMKATELLKRFILEGGFDVEEWRIRLGSKGVK